MDSRPTRHIHTLLALEVGIEARERPREVVVIESIPGREGTLTRSWRLTEGRLDGPQVDDLAGWLLSAVTTAIATRIGVQETLFPTLAVDRSPQLP